MYNIVLFTLTKTTNMSLTTTAYTNPTFILLLSYLPDGWNLGSKAKGREHLITANIHTDTEHVWFCACYNHPNTYHFLVKIILP